VELSPPILLAALVMESLNGFSFAMFPCMNPLIAYIANLSLLSVFPPLFLFLGNLDMVGEGVISFGSVSWCSSKLLSSLLFLGVCKMSSFISEVSCFSGSSSYESGSGRI
jgi:hypothetical protein